MLGILRTRKALFVLVAIGGVLLAVVLQTGIFFRRTAEDVEKSMRFVKLVVRPFGIGCGPWQFACDSDEKPPHNLLFNGCFEMGIFEVTQEEWRVVMGEDPQGLRFKGCDLCPVENVSWNDVQEFVRRLNQIGQHLYRLPTEAEWEFACRSGGKAEKFCGGKDLSALAWFNDNSEGRTHPVGSKEPNGLGIHDMSGNVEEWTCSDWSRYGDEGTPHTRCGQAGSTERVYRGGSWYYSMPQTRSSARHSFGSDVRTDTIGFRLVRKCSPA